MNHSYNNSNYDFFGLKSDKKKKSEGNAYPYRADLNYDYAPQLSAKTSSSEKPSLFAPQSEGERIRKLLQSAVDKALGKGKYSGLFDNIDTKKIEENIPVAESVIKKNKEKNAYSMEDTKNLPYLRDGLAAFYALSEAGNYKAANAARKIAYTPLAQAEKKRETESRYVGEDNLLLHSAPGERAPDIASLSRGDELYFTGNKTNEKDSNSWAEVRYGDKTGWVKSNSLKTDKSQAFAGTRYVGEETISMRAAPGFRGHTKETIDYGKEVHFTGNKETLDGIDWAEVEYGGKTGWVIADYLRTNKSSDMSEVDLSDHEGLQSSFYKVTETFTKDDLQCVFLTRWFLNNYTTLQTSTGDGFAQAKNTFDANSDKNLQISNIPSAPAIYSVAPYSAGPGISEERATKWGHTGIILDCQKVSGKEDTYNITYFHTGSSFKGKPFNCAITTKEVKVNDAVTYVNIGNYMK